MADEQPGWSLSSGHTLLAVVVYASFLVGNIDSARAETPSELFATSAKGSNVVVDHSQWDVLLKTYVFADPDNLNRVDYAKFKTTGHDALKTYVRQLEKVDPRRLDRAEQFALRASLAQYLIMAESQNAKSELSSWVITRLINRAFCRVSSAFVTRPATRGMDALAADALDPSGTDATEATRKLSLLKSGPEKDIYDRRGPQTPASPYQLMAGTILAASPVSGLNSDLPGLVIAEVTENVFDTVSGRFRPILQGSRLIVSTTTS